MNKIFDDKYKKKPSKKELYDLINCYTKEIERLNNTINELEKSIDSKLKEFEDNKDYFIDETVLKDLKNELQELKGSGK